MYVYAKFVWVQLRILFFFFFFLIEWIIHSIYGVKIFHSLRSEFHSILTPVEWKFNILNEWNLVRFTRYSLQKEWSLRSLPREWPQWRKKWKFTQFLREYTNTSRVCFCAFATTPPSTHRNTPLTRALGQKLIQECKPIQLLKCEVRWSYITFILLFWSMTVFTSQLINIYTRIEAI